MGSYTSSVNDKVLELFGLDDIVIEISVTPNRGDALGVFGIARDLAAAGVGKLIFPDIPINKEIKYATIDKEEYKYSPLIALREFTGLKNGESPDWLRHYLQNIGVGSISAIVDITNYICYSFGRPMHAYDKSKLSGNLKISLACTDEKFLSGSTRRMLAWKLYMSGRVHACSLRPAIF